MQLLDREELPLVLDLGALEASDIGWEYQGFQHGSLGISVIIVAAPAGMGPRLHWHPYKEVFIVQEGEATFTVGDETLVVRGGKVVIAPANVPHKFVNSGSGILRQVDIHESPQFITHWLE